MMEDNTSTALLEHPADPDADTAADNNAVTMYRWHADQFSLVIGTQQHGPRWSSRLTRAQMRRIAYRILLLTED